MAETVLNQQESKFEPSVENHRQNNHLLKIIGVVLSLIMIALTVYVLNLQHQNNNILSTSTGLALTSSDLATVNYMTYKGRYKETKIELEETTRKLEIVKSQLDQVSAELATTKGMLSQTQVMLVSAQDENTKLKQELQGLESLRAQSTQTAQTTAQTAQNVQSIDELQAKINALKARDSQVSLQLSDLKSQLRAFQAQFSSPEEGRSLIVLFQSKINLVKNRMRYLKQEAFFARVAAQKEKDRVALLNGNSGFVVRNGQAQNPNSAKKSFAIDVKIEP